MRGDHKVALAELLTVLDAVDDESLLDVTTDAMRARHTNMD